MISVDFNWDESKDEDEAITALEIHIARADELGVDNAVVAEARDFLGKGGAGSMTSG